MIEITKLHTLNDTHLKKRAAASKFKSFVIRQTQWKLSWDCMIEPQAGHSSHSNHCPSEVGEGVWGKIAIPATLYNLPRPETTPTSSSSNRCTKVTCVFLLNTYCILCMDGETLEGLDLKLKHCTIEGDIEEY